MKKGGGKSKGGTFERKVAKDLSLWFSKGKREDLYWRSSLSGGRSTVAYGKGKHLQATVGDISSIDPEGAVLTKLFLIECKHVRNLNLDSMIKGHGKFLEFWQKLRSEAIKYKRMPMLIARQNNYPILVAMKEQSRILSGIDMKHEIICAILPRYDCQIMFFDQWLSRTDPDLFAKAKLDKH